MTSQCTKPPAGTTPPRANNENLQPQYSTMDRLREGLQGFKGNPDNFTAKCPGHDDHENSLQVELKDSGKISITCYAGCDLNQILDPLGIEAKDLYPPEDRPEPKAKQVECTYPYRDANGTLLYEVVRYRPKDFRQRRPDGAGGWIWSLKDVERVMYRLPEVLKAKASRQTIYLVEGEKDVHSLVALGLCATTNAGGASKWQASFTATLKGADVVILPDNDEPGRKAAQARHEALPGSVVLMLPGLALKGDVSDWIAQGGTVEALQALVEEARANPMEKVKTEILPLTDLSNWRTLAREPIDHIFHEGLKAGSFGVVAAEGNTGKSFLSLELAISVAIGRKLIDGFRPTRSGCVLVCFGEDDPEPVTQRIEAVCNALSVSPDEIDAAIADGRLQAICGRSKPLLVPMVGGSYSHSGMHDELMERCQKNQYRLVVIDPVIKWAGVSSENDAPAMEAAAGALIELAKATNGGAVLALHHANKHSGRSGDNTQSLSRGSSAFTDAARWVVTLRRLDEENSKGLNVPRECLPDYLESRVVKNSYAKIYGHRTFLKREEGGALVSAQLENRGADLLTAICEELIENPVNLTRDEAAHRAGSVAETFRESLARRAGFTPKQTEINSAILAGIEVKLLSEDRSTDGRPGRPRPVLRVLQKLESA